MKTLLACATVMGITACLFSGALRADDAAPVEQVDLKTYAAHIDLKKYSFPERDFYKALVRDGMGSIDSRVHSSSLESDAQMLLAIQQGDTEALEDVLEHGVEPNQYDPDRLNHSPVYWAVYFNRPEMVKMLLDHRAQGWLPDTNTNESPLELAQKMHPGMIPMLREGMKRNEEILAAQLSDQLHALHIDVPAFSGASFQDVSNFLIAAMERVHAGYLERSPGVGIRYRSAPPVTTTPAMRDVSIWDALQAIADADHMKFRTRERDVSFYTPSDEAIMRHDP